MESHSSIILTQQEETFLSSIFDILIQSLCCVIDTKTLLLLVVKDTESILVNSDLNEFFMSAEIRLRQGSYIIQNISSIKKNVLKNNKICAVYLIDSKILKFTGIKRFFVSENV